MSTQLTVLNDRTVISVSGPDARDFLQRVITTDMGRLAPGTLLPGALLTPQGKIVTDFLLHGHETGVWIEVWHGAADSLVKRLTLYRLRANADIAIDQDRAVVTGTGTADPRSPDLPPRAIRERSGLDAQTGTLAGREIAAGVPAFGRDYGEADVFPTDVNLDLQGGIGWKKGCFIGQEVLSRMKRRGTIRKRSARVTSAGEPLSQGQDVVAGDTVVGQLTSAEARHGIARVRTDRIEKAAADLIVNGQPVDLVLPTED